MHQKPTTMPEPLILITNDDGITAPGLRTLIQLLRPLGQILVVAPEGPRSGMGHAITITVPLHLQLITKEPNYSEYSSNGTPADCVKLAMHKLLAKKPDIIVSGINHGSNSSVNVIYSGTIAAVIEGMMNGIPSIGFSLLDYSMNAHFDHAGKYIRRIVENVLEKGLPSGIGLNVNIPQKNHLPIKGIKICRQAEAYWKEEFDERTDPRTQKPYYWLTGNFYCNDKAEDTDEWALENNFISLVPIQFDLTAHQWKNHFKNWETHD